MLSDKIRELRKHSGLSQEELAERIDVSRQAVSKWELGAAVLTADKLVELADFFGVSLDYLMREGEAFPQEEMPKRTGNRRKIAAWCLIAAALLGFALLGALCALKSLTSVSGSFTLRIDGVGIIAILAVLCAAAGVVLLISLKKIGGIMKTSSKILVGISAALLAAFAAKNIINYASYVKTINSAPFDVNISINALFLVIPAAVLAAIALFLERKTRIPVICAAIFAAVVIEELMRQIAVYHFSFLDGLLLAIPYIAAAVIFAVFAIISKKRGL